VRVSVLNKRFGVALINLIVINIGETTSTIKRPATIANEVGSGFLILCVILKPNIVPVNGSTAARIIRLISRERPTSDDDSLAKLNRSDSIVVPASFLTAS